MNGDGGNISSSSSSSTSISSSSSGSGSGSGGSSGSSSSSSTCSPDIIRRLHVRKVCPTSERHTQGVGVCAGEKHVVAALQRASIVVDIMMVIMADVMMVVVVVVVEAMACSASSQGVGSLTPLLAPACCRTRKQFPL
jgi:hypothetical protein